MARVLLEDGTAGFGFSPDLDAGLARDMAAWDAYARAAGRPLWRILGGTRPDVPVAMDGEAAVEPDWEKLHRAMRGRRYRLLRVNPFAWGSLERVETIVAAAADLDTALALLAPNGHPWEIAWCAALAGDGARVIVRDAPRAGIFQRKEDAGAGIPWTMEPALDAVRWLAPAQVYNPASCPNT